MRIRDESYTLFCELFSLFVLIKWFFFHYNTPFVICSTLVHSQVESLALPSNGILPIRTKFSLKPAACNRRKQIIQNLNA